MIRHLMIVPEGWPCELGACPPGPFVFGDILGIKTQYAGDGPYLAENGDAFWGGAKDVAERAHLMVQPCTVVWKTEL